MTERNPEYFTRNEVIDPRILRLLKENVETWQDINPNDYKYGKLLIDIFQNGEVIKDRTGVGTIKVHGRQLKFDMLESFPILTTKSVWPKGVLTEAVWFKNGETNIKYLIDRGVHIWDEWAFQPWLKTTGLEINYPMYSHEWYEFKDQFAKMIKTDRAFADKYGDLGPIYGYQWRHWKNPDGTEIDQLQNAIDRLITKPYDRRIIVTAWNPSVVDQMALPPCHLYYQFSTSPDGKYLDCFMLMRSVDVFLGLPFNISSYAALTHMVANVVSENRGEVMTPRELTVSLVDTHVYLNHPQFVSTQLLRQPYPPETKLLILSNIANINDITPEGIKIKNYTHHQAIKAPIAV